MDMNRRVWVKLSLVVPRRPDLPMPAQLPHPRAVDVAAEVPGSLLQWLRTAGGKWLGLVTYQLPFADERHQRIYLDRHGGSGIACRVPNAAMGPDQRF